MVEPDNGERDHSKPKCHNAKLCPFAIRQRIVNALANGDSKRAISRALRVSNNTVTAVAEQEWQQVEARKHRLAAQYERNANLANDLITADLESAKPGDKPLAVLNVISGTATDKILAIRGESSSTVRHIHSVDLREEDVIAFAVHRSKQLKQLSEKRAQAAVVEVAEHAPSANTRNRNPRKH